jgi:PTS system galactitol-specific IIB component
MKKQWSKHRINVVAVCGSGIVTSGMLQVRLEEIFNEEGLKCLVDTTSPSGLERILESRRVDMIISVTPLTEMKGITCPVVHGHALLSGIGEEEVIEEIRKVGHEVAENLEKTLGQK